MKWFWCPLFFIFFLIEMFSQRNFCGSGELTGQMWLMWLVMSLMSVEELIKKVKNGN